MRTPTAAEKHPPEYRIHKYWARKPANVVREFIEAHAQPGDAVLDPFCGSGVTVIEAAKLGRRAVGIDLNPTAAMIARTSTQACDLDELQSVWDRLMESWLPQCREAYALEDREPARYCVHGLMVRCPNCDGTARADACPRNGNRRRCPHCKETLNCSLMNACGSQVVSVHGASGETLSSSEELTRQTKTSAAAIGTSRMRERFDRPLLANSRILAHAGMTTASLFTKRNFSLLSLLAEAIRAQDAAASTKDALWTAFTSAVASCSRLIPYRNNMQGGGPAWTVPGFWVPPLHLERNPALHLPTRFNKLVKGLRRLSGALGTQPVSIRVGDACEELRKRPREKFRYVFADPPYGDSVPYLEFSQIWNCWLDGPRPDFDREAVVSDRADPPCRWDEYAVRLTDIFAEVRQAMLPDGRLTVTFNNLDVKAWAALLGALQASRFVCEDVRYQTPAVVAAKASFSPTGSCLGDVYATFFLGGANANDADVSYADAEAVTDRLREAEALRGGAVSRVTQTRTAALTVLEENVRADALLDLEGRFASLPGKTPPIPADCPLFAQIQAALEAVNQSVR
ncbi:MAG: DNA methyltransferase, partial [Planctomycetales bacterium]